jgi:hypothetical protein
MKVKYTTIFHSKAFRNVPKEGFFVLQINHLATLLTSGCKSSCSITDGTILVEYYRRKQFGVLT